VKARYQEKKLRKGSSDAFFIGTQITYLADVMFFFICIVRLFINDFNLTVINGLYIKIYI
jgi:hypothetical protein